MLVCEDKLRQGYSPFKFGECQKAKRKVMELQKQNEGFQIKLI